MKTYYFLLCAFLSFFSVNAQNMNNEQLEKILYVMSDTIRGQNGQWELIVNELPMLCFTDERNNRMRIICPIKEVKDVTYEEREKCLEANFHSALDVRYAMAEGYMWSAFIHPLKELTKDQVIDAIQQVYVAALTYGDIYTSTDLTFPKSKQDKSIKDN